MYNTQIALLLFVFNFDLFKALYWIAKSQMPEHASVTRDVCARWIEELGIYLPGKCPINTAFHDHFFGAYMGNQYIETSPDVNKISLR